ncbi:MAG TPA: helix-turn-helix domain-containing protein [Nitrososphaerales archaeon]|nr:helix-turn-helix domain-containing protein [Nitrososphaerales archaeon]
MPASCCTLVTCDSPDCLQLTEREAQVCITICSSEEPLAFSAVKNRLGYHQEVVSRILRRLMNYGAVEKFRGKYRRVSQ